MIRRTGKSVQYARKAVEVSESVFADRLDFIPSLLRRGRFCRIGGGGIFFRYSNHSSLRSPGDGAGDVGKDRELGTAGDKKGFNRRKNFLNAVYYFFQPFHFFWRDSFTSAC